jgi:hypothetical protein
MRLGVWGSEISGDPFSLSSNNGQRVASEQHSRSGNTALSRTTRITWEPRPFWSDGYPGKLDRQRTADWLERSPVRATSAAPPPIGSRTPSGERRRASRIPTVSYCASRTHLPHAAGKRSYPRRHERAATVQWRVERATGGCSPLWLFRAGSVAALARSPFISSRSLLTVRYRAV